MSLLNLVFFLVEFNVKQKRVFWEEPKKDSVKSHVLQFDGVPFLIRGLVVLNCQHGRDKNQARKKKNATKQIEVHHVYTTFIYSQDNAERIAVKYLLIHLLKVNLSVKILTCVTYGVYYRFLQYLYKRMSTCI